MFTERKALERLFQEIQQEKQTIKEQYALELSSLREKEKQVLERLQTLDKTDREAVDIENVFKELIKATQSIKDLIPDIPLEWLLEKTASKMAEEATKSGMTIEAPSKAQISQESEKGIRVLESEKNAAGAIVRRKKPKEVLETIEELILEHGNSPRTSKWMEEKLKERMGWEWKNFSMTLSGYRRSYSHRLIKQGRKYSVDMTAEQEAAISHEQRFIQKEATSIC